LTTLANGQAHVDGFVQDATNFYWTNGDLVTMSKSGGTITTIKTGVAALGMAVDANNVYWSDPNSLTVNSVPISGGTVTKLATTPYYPGAIAVDSTNVYYSTSGNGVFKVPIGGGSTTVLATTFGQSRTLATDGVYLYWADEGMGHLYRVLCAGGPLTTLSSAGASRILLKGPTIYWTPEVNNSNSFESTPVGGGGDTFLAQVGKGTPYGLAVENSVAYIASADGNVYSILYVF